MKWYSQWKLASFAIIPSLSCVQYFQHIYILDTHNGATTACSIAQCRGAQFSLSKLTADCAAKSVPASSISIHLHYYNCSHYCCNDRQGAKYVDTNIPDQGSLAKFLCSVIMPRGVGTGGLWCVRVVFVQVCVCVTIVCMFAIGAWAKCTCVYMCVCICVTCIWEGVERIAVKIMHLN